MAAPAPAKDGGFRPAGDVPASGEVAAKQKQVWDSVAATQSKLAGGPQLQRRLANLGDEPAAQSLKTRGCKAPAPAIWRR